MKLQFEEFKEVGRKASNEPIVTVTHGGHLNLNKKFMETFVKEKKYAVLFYDKANKVIGLKLMNEEKMNSYKIRSYRGGNLGAVTAIAFLKYHNIEHDKTRSYKAEWNKEHGMVVIDLKQKEI